MQITLDNFTNWKDGDVRRLIRWIAQDLRLKGDIRFIFQAQWTEIDDYGDAVPGTEQDVGFDGDAYDNGVVRVCVAPSMEYPFAYDINDELDGLYLRNIVELKDPWELFLYMASHELRHLWQWEHPDKARQIRRLMKCDDETDADMYAIRNLSRYRSRGNAKYLPKG